jgi:hypothetical protein
MASEGGMLHIAYAKGICHEFIKIYGSMSYTNGVMGFRNKAYISCLKSSENNL